MILSLTWLYSNTTAITCSTTNTAQMPGTRLCYRVITLKGKKKVHGELHFWENCCNSAQKQEAPKVLISQTSFSSWEFVHRQSFQQCPNPLSAPASSALCRYNPSFSWFRWVCTVRAVGSQNHFSWKRPLR